MTLRSFFHLLFVLLQAAACAQDIAFTVHAGGNITVHNDPLGAPHGPPPRRAAYGPGYCFGTVAEFRASTAVRVLLGLTLDSRSTSYAFDEGQNGYPVEELADGMDRGERTVRSHMAELPVMIAYRGLSGLRLEAGLQVGRLIDAQRIERGDRLLDGVRHTLHERESITHELSQWEGALVLGAMIEGPHRIHAMLRYVHGLTNLDEGSGSPASYTRQIQMGLVYALGSRRAQERTAM